MITYYLRVIFSYNYNFAILKQYYEYKIHDYHFLNVDCLNMGLMMEVYWIIYSYYSIFQ